MTRLFDAKPFIVAEVGSNWRDLSDCLVSIAFAKECGADAVKFQAFNYEALYGVKFAMDHPIAGAWIQYPGGKVDHWPQNDMPHALPLNWLPRLKAHADAVGIEFMCSAFSPELVAAVDPFVEVHKVASAEAAWPQLLEAVAKTGKPVLISFGAKTTAERSAILTTFGLHSTTEPVEMDCVASYPADFADLQYRFDLNEGLSDHTLGYTASVVAARLGATAIEKHFTAFPDLDTPDRPHSLTPTQFKRMVDIIRGREVESEEGAMFARHNRRLIATRDIAQGESLVYGQNYGAYRSLVDDTRGLSPFAWREVEGRCTTTTIKRGVSIGGTDFC